MKRKKFEQWYLKTYLANMPTGKESMTFLRNEFGDYENDHMQGSWECYNVRSGSESTIIPIIKGSLLAIVVMIFICAAACFRDYK